jgi:hypothetical protein
LICQVGNYGIYTKVDRPAHIVTRASQVGREAAEGGGMKPYWWLTKDGDRTVLQMYERHYSAYRYKDGRKRGQFVGPGEKVVLRTLEGDACFAWRNFIDDSGQDGINCAIFRNESPLQSSLLIRQADAIADFIWPDRRHYTYVNPQAVRSRNPGFCFIKAGWKRCGRTKGGLLILERIAVSVPGSLTRGLQQH